MNETQSYIIDIINLVSEQAICFIQAPSIESSEFLDLMAPSSFEYYKQVILSPSNKKKLIDIIINENIQNQFHCIEIRHSGELIFEGYDGMEFGTVSKNLNLTDQFIENYINQQMCTISNEW